PQLICPASGPIILVQRGRNWKSFTCNNPAGTSPGTVDISPNAGSTFLAKDCEVYTPEHVFYRLTADSNSDGICDTPAGVCVNEEYADCKIERCIHDVTPPQSTSTGCTWETIGTNIAELHFRYFQAATMAELTPKPLGATDLGSVGVVRITMIGRDRGKA